MLVDRQQLVEQHMGLVEKIARKVGYGYRDVDDLISYSYEELIKFSRMWNPKVEIPFEAYLLTYLKPRLSRYKRMHKTVVSIPQRYSGRDLSVFSIEGNQWIEEINDGTDIAESICDKQYNTKRLNEAFQLLTDIEKKVFDALYNVGLTVNEVAYSLKLSQPSVSAAKQRALFKLRKYLAA